MSWRHTSCNKRTLLCKCAVHGSIPHTCTTGWYAAMTLNQLVNPKHVAGVSENVSCVAVKIYRVFSTPGDAEPQHQSSHTARQHIIRPSKQHKLQSSIRTAHFMAPHSPTLPPFISTCQQAFVTLTTDASLGSLRSFLGPVLLQYRLHLQPKAPTPLLAKRKHSCVQIIS